MDAKTPRKPRAKIITTSRVETDKIEKTPGASRAAQSRDLRNFPVLFHLTMGLISRAATAHNEIHFGCCPKFRAIKTRGFVRRLRYLSLDIVRV